MTADLAEQRTTLERELANLDALLASDPDWMVFCSLEAERARAEGGLPSQREAAWRQIRARLSGNRIFCARERIVEAIALVREELERRAPGESAKNAQPAEDSEIAKSDRDIAVAPAVVEAVASPSNAVVCSSTPCMMSQLGDQMSLGSDPLGQSDMRAGLADDKARILSRGRAKVRVQTKVAIRLKPPDATSIADDLGGGPDDDLTLIRGIDVVTADKLNALGVRRYRQIARWSARDVASVRAALGLGVKISSENWIEQAALLEARVESDARVPEPHPHPEPVPERRAVDNRETGTDTIEADVASPPQSVSSVPSAVAAASAAISAKLGARLTAEREAPGEPTPNCVALASAAILKDLGSSSPPPPDEAKPAREDDPVGEQEIIREQLFETDGAQLPDTPSDVLICIRGIDAELADLLISAGTTHFLHIAHWTASDIASLSVGLKLGQKITREAWVEQAAVLAGGASTVYSRHIESGLPCNSGALIDWDIRVDPREHDRNHEPDTEFSSPVSTACDEDIDLSFEASGHDLEPVVAMRTPPPLPLPLPEIALPTLPAQNQENAQQAFLIGEDLGEQDFGEADVEIVAARGVDERDLSDDDFGEAEIEIVAARGGEDANLEGGDFGEAEIEIVSGPRAPLPEQRRSLEPSLPRNLDDEALIKIVPLPEVETRPPARAQPDDAFDADDYAGYSGDVNEASVSIILNGEHGANGSIDPLAVSAAPRSGQQAFDPLEAKKPLVE